MSSQAPLQTQQSMPLDTQRAHDPEVLRTIVRAQAESSDPTHERTTRSRGVVRRFLREPLLHFLLLGIALFGINTYRENQARFTQITIGPDQVRRIADNYRMQYGGLPSAPQLQALVDKYIDEEVLYREALKLGLDREDEIVRRRLIQKYEFLQQDLTTPTEPTDAQLQEYYGGHLDHYRVPEQVTFTQVYFSTDHRGEQGARDAALALSTSLNRKAVTRATDRGDPFPGPTDYTALTRDELVRVFGAEGLSTDIFAVDPGRWSAPLRSGYGWHTVYVSTRQATRSATLAQAREQIRQDYLESERTRRNAEALAKLRAEFTVVRQGPRGTAP